MICLICFPVNMIFNPSLQMSDIDPMDPLIYKYIPGVMLVFFLPYHHLAPIIGISASFLYLFFFLFPSQRARPWYKEIISHGWKGYLSTKHKLFNTYFPGSFRPCMACCTNSCMFRRHYQGSVLHFDKDLRNKN